MGIKLARRAVKRPTLESDALVAIGASYGTLLDRIESAQPMAVGVDAVLLAESQATLGWPGLKPQANVAVTEVLQNAILARRRRTSRYAKVGGEEEICCEQFGGGDTLRMLAPPELVAAYRTRLCVAARAVEGRE